MAQETSILIEVSPDGTSWTPLTTKAADSVNHSHTGLTAGTTRHYRIKAVGNGTTTADSPWVTATATTATAPGTPLTAPAVTARPSVSVVNALRLDWGDIANNSGYQIQYSTDGVNWLEAGTVGTGVVTFLLEGLTADTLYHVRVRALGTGSFANSAYSAAVSARTDKFLETFETFDTLDTWTVTNPDPTKVSIGVNAGMLEVKALGTGTTTNYYANNIRKTTGYPGYPFTMEAHFGVGSEAVIHALGWDIGGAAGSVFYVKRGSVSNPGAFSIVVTNAGALQIEQDFVSAQWTVCNGLRIVSAAANDHKVYARKIVGGTWELVASFTFAMPEGDKKPAYMIQGGTVTKTLSSDYIRLYA